MGCGWLGTPLAESLLQKGHKIHGSTTSGEKCALLEQKGIQGFLIRLSENRIEGDISGFLTNVDVLIINIPPKLRGTARENYVQKIQLLHNAIKASKTRKVIFVSSTSIYGDVNGEVTEDTVPQPNTESGRQLLAAENLLTNDKALQTTIVRFGGLIGVDRHPINMLAGRQGLSNGEAYVNLIHQKDCIRILEHIIDQDWWNEVFNGVYPYHPTKKEYYTSEALNKGLQSPEYEVNNTVKGKKVLPFRLISVKKFSFETSIVS